MKLLVGLIFLLTMFTRFSQAQDISITEVDSVLYKQVKSDGPGCVVGIIKNGVFIHKKAYGLANLDFDIPLSTASVFRIASCSKQFTAATVFLLVSQGKLKLRDDIRKYLKDFPFYGDTIRIENLIHHTSGLRDYTGLMYLSAQEDDYQYTPNDLYALIIRQKETDFIPGTQFSYSNTGYFLLSKIVASITNSSLNEYSRQNIFSPLGMKNTHFHDNHRVIVKNRAYGYAYKGNNYEILMGNNDVVGDGGIFTTLDDLRIWDENFYSHRVGGSFLIEQMETPGKLNDGSLIPYAGGLYIRKYRGLKRIIHTGIYAGFKASICRYPDEKISIFILANGPDISPAILTNQITNIILKDKVISQNSIPNESASNIATDKITKQEIPEILIKELTGDFFSPELNIYYKLYTKNEKLYCRIGNNKIEEVYFAGKNKLMIDEYMGFSPIQNKKGSVVTLSVFVGDSKNINFHRVNK